MRVVVYYAGSGGVLYEKESFDVSSIVEARGVISNMFMVEFHCAEWNVRKAWMASSMVEAHVFGYCQDEQVHLVLEDDDRCDFLSDELYKDCMQ